ncbi:CobW family GTP-binding protein [Aliikangiella sp. IMCC44359]|uniref:CobW family GTP-binding protein n=1 Tax=Aliikangiella sp. IMCC44359 TaxID=3459125 RepID=UPI00403A99DF
MKKSSQLIDVNIITGFLGVGKTTAIQMLIQQKPKGEKWAVLINEFGEVGIDGGLVSGQLTEKDQLSAKVFVREIPGGCMCCASGLPMQVALNQLIQQVKPDRLLIEPTGLGHPAEIMSVLSNEIYRRILSIKTVITLVDARKIADPRYTSHETFKQQIQIADIVVANKSDLYVTNEIEQLKKFLVNSNDVKTVESTQQAKIPIEWLDLHYNTEQSNPNKTHSHAHQSVAEYQLPDSGYLRIDNTDGEYHSSGWIFDAKLTFKHEAVLALLNSLSVERIKGIVITEKDILGFNLSEKVLSYYSIDEVIDSRVEVIDIDPSRWKGLEEELLHCII